MNWRWIEGYECLLMCFGFVVFVFGEIVFGVFVVENGYLLVLCYFGDDVGGGDVLIVFVVFD